jgi:hypothetical protein
MNHPIVPLRVRPSAPVALALTVAATAQQPGVDWLMRLPVPASASHTAAIARDPITRRPLRLASDRSTDSRATVWQWTGSDWLRREARPSPELWGGHALASDELRGRLVVFGGNGASRDTWTWDGRAWAAYPTPLLLTPRSGHAMAFDAGRGRVVLFGGGAASSALGDTWEWDGAQWTLCQPGAPPPPRTNHAMAFDAARGTVVLFGGASGAVALADTWEWDGTYWRQRFPAVRPSARSAHALAYDEARQRVVLFGGGAMPVFGTRETWEWDGTVWRLVPTATSPSARNGHAMVFDPHAQRVVMFGAPAGLDDVWEYDGVDWVEVIAATAPPARVDAAMTYDLLRREAVLFGGQLGSTVVGDTWLWNGERWRRANPALLPNARCQHGLAFDEASGVAVLFGGTTPDSGSSSAFHDDTWTWDGAGWTFAPSAARPAPRAGMGLAYHAATRRIVLFGGAAGSGISGVPFGDTWTWDGTGWTQESPATAPTARTSTSMVGDGRDIVLFGGRTWTTSLYQSTDLGDTWLWNGTTWLQRQPATSPAPRNHHQMAFDRQHGRVLLHGGLPGSGTYPDDTWAFDGTTWSLVAAPTRPEDRYGAAMTYDALSQQAVMFGGMRTTWLGETWTLGERGTESSFGAACVGSLGPPSLRASPHSLARPGGILVADVGALPTSLAILAIGFSNTTTGTSPLPFALAAFGMPGCDLLVSADAALLLAGSGNAATWSVPLPASAGLFGVGFFGQAFALDAAANAAGLTASNGVSFRVGH